MTVKERPDIVRFKNTSDEDFTWWYDKSKGGNALTIKAGQEIQMPVHKAQVFANHLVTRILQKQGIKFYKRATPLRKKIMGEILPDLPDYDIEATPMNEEEKAKAFQEQLAKDLNETKEEMAKREDKRDKEIAGLRAELDALKQPKPVKKSEPKS